MCVRVPACLPARARSLWKAFIGDFMKKVKNKFLSWCNAELLDS
jgi:hypothetical protein